MTGRDVAAIDSALVFDARGVLPAGDYPMTLGGLRRSILIEGPPGRTMWDGPWREWLLDQFATLVGQLWGVGVGEIYLAGSFVSDRDRPGDIDGYFVCERAAYKTRTLHRALNELGPFRHWTWRNEHRSPAPDGRLKLPFWHHHRVELYPYYGQPRSGFLDRQGNDLATPDLFRMVRETHEPRGVVRLIRWTDRC